MTNIRCPSNRATADGGECHPLQQKVPPAPLDDEELPNGQQPTETTAHIHDLWKQGGGQPLGQTYNICFRKEASQINYMDIRKIMDRRAIQQKKRLLSDAEIQKLVMEWQDV